MRVEVRIGLFVFIHCFPNALVHPFGCKQRQGMFTATFRALDRHGIHSGLPFDVQADEYFTAIGAAEDIFASDHNSKKLISIPNDDCFWHQTFLLLFA